jgi:predicted amidohydrolase
MSRARSSRGHDRFHTHVYWGGTSIGVEAEPIARRSGTTTFVDAGTAGPANFPGFRRHEIEPSRVRILAYLNVSFAGIFAFSRTVMVGEASDLRLLDLNECVRVAREHRDLIVGIKVRVGRGAGGSSGIAPLDMALEVAEELGLPVMAHIDHPPPSRKEVLGRLRPGDVLTHCYRPFPNSLLRSDGAVREEALMARERGVTFDIGHGAGSFGFHACRGLLAAGFPPDVISSDVHVLNVDGPGVRSAHDDVQVSCARRRCERAGRCRHRRAGARDPPAVARHAGGGQRRRRDRRRHRARRVRVPRHAGRTPCGGPTPATQGMVVAGQWWQPAGGKA